LAIPNQKWLFRRMGYLFEFGKHGEVTAGAGEGFVNAAAWYIGQLQKPRWKHKINRGLKM
jgi:hypothetical protein